MTPSDNLRVDFLRNDCSNRVCMSTQTMNLGFSPHIPNLKSSKFESKIVVIYLSKGISLQHRQQYSIKTDCIQFEYIESNTPFTFQLLKIFTRAVASRAQVIKISIVGWIVRSWTALKCP